jgi:hypothetical protein
MQQSGDATKLHEALNCLLDTAPPERQTKTLKTTIHSSLTDDAIPGPTSLVRSLHRDWAAVGAFGDRGSTTVVTSPVWTS